MKHIFISQGRKFISSKRAAKISGYATDYVGQLCRQGKIEAKMTGHTWFVNEEAFVSHCVQSGKMSASSAKVFLSHSNRQKPSSRKPSTDAASHTTLDALTGETRLSAKEIAVKFGYTSDYVGQLCRSGKLDARMIGHTWFVTEASLISYRDGAVPKIPDAKEGSATTEPTLEKKDLAPLSAGILSYAAEEQVALPPLQKEATYAEDLKPVFEKMSLIPPSETRVKSFWASKLSRTAILAFSIIVLAVSAVTMKSAFPASASPVANVYDAFHAIGSSLARIFDGIGQEFAYLFASQPHLSTTISPAPSGSSDGGSRGLVVVPSSGTSDGDQTLKKNIQESFSDQVVVSPDKSGTAGVITPVFKQTTGDNFVYVLVPVKDSASKK